MHYSSKKSTHITLAIGYKPKAVELLTDFANTHPEDYERFDWKWQYATRGWRGGRASFEETQRIIREIWEGKLKGREGGCVEAGLGLSLPIAEYGHSSQSALIKANWAEGTLWAARRDLNDDVWLILLSHSNRLAVCANRENGCPTPYFVKKKANQKFCCEECAAPAQRAFKRQWFREHGDEWRKKWLKKQKKSKTQSRKMGGR
jgi:hypothetical protein